ncbi:MAG: MotA/TolQ/ExbB proton channel family protein [Kiritimatiellae bacterium]|nr:MotA/TolQ/ExbB proton channel family protein [Kiritimatiellia bacterium]
MNRERNWRFSIAHLSGNTGAAMLMVLAIVMGGGAGFINIPSMMIVFAVAFFMMFACYGGEYMRFLGASFAILAFRPVHPNKRYAEMARYAARFMIAGGVAGTLIGFIQMLRNMTDPSAIGSGMAVALITILYAVLAAEFWCLFAYKVFSGNERESNPDTGEKPLSLYPVGLAVGVALWSILLFMIVLLMFSSFGEGPGTVRSVDPGMDAYSVGDEVSQHHFVKLGAFRINVGSGEEAGVLEVSPVLEMTAPSCTLTRHYGSILRDAFQSAIRAAQAQALQNGTDDVEALKPAIQQAMNEKLSAFSDNRIQSVYFEDYVILR